MQGSPPLQKPRFVQPLAVIARQSTDIVAIEDPVIASAMRFIREHACEGIRVEDVAAHAKISRRSLERTFIGCLRTSPHAQIARIQLERIKQLLAESDLPVEAVSRKAGFEYAAYMGVFFKKATGQTPGEFRQAARPINGSRRSPVQAKGGK
jgi:LacI family transcriptional regulator